MAKIFMVEKYGMQGDQEVCEARDFWYCTPENRWETYLRGELLEGVKSGHSPYSKIVLTEMVRGEETIQKNLDLV